MSQGQQYTLTYLLYGMFITEVLLHTVHSEQRCLANFPAEFLNRFLLHLPLLELPMKKRAIHS